MVTSLSGSFFKNLEGGIKLVRIAGGGISVGFVEVRL